MEIDNVEIYCLRSERIITDFFAVHFVPAGILYTSSVRYVGVQTHCRRCSEEHKIDLNYLHRAKLCMKAKVSTKQ